MRRASAILSVLVLAGCTDDTHPDAPSADASDAGDASDGDHDAAGDAGDVAPDGSADACAACDADGGPPAACVPASSGTVETWTVRGWTIGLDRGDGAWSVTPPHADAPVLAAPPTCLAEGRASVRVATGTPTVVNEFGAFRITLEGARTAMTWVDAAAPPAPVDLDADGLALRYSLAGTTETALLTFTALGDDLRVALEGDFDGGSIAWTLAGDESWFGLGSQVTGLDLRGRRYPLWTQEQGNGKPEVAPGFPLQNVPEAAYAPMGVWHSSAGWSAVVAHDAYSDIDLGATDPDLASLRSYAALPGFVMVSGATPRDRVTAVTAYTGRLPSDPAPWTFGPWNDSVGGGERLREVATILRESDIPSSAIWSEDWIGGEQSGTGYRLSYAWEWDPDTYPDLPDDIAWLHDNGFAFLAYFNTFVPQPTRMWDEGVEGGYLIERADGSVRTIVDPAFRTAGLVDLTDPAAVTWLRSYLDTAADTLGIDGWMADFTEWAPVDGVLEDGTDPWHFHNRYPLLWQQVNRDALQAAHPAGGADPENNWTYFARSGWASVNGGSGGIAPTMWGGDQNTNWAYDDGYPTVVPISTHLGLSGVSIFGSDVGGYNALFGTPTSKELFLRWSAMAAFHPLMRTHHGSNECANWSFDRDADTLAHYRRWASVHTLLYPVFRALTADARLYGWPIVRHPWLVAPERPELWSGDDFLFFVGDDVLVAPVLVEGAMARTVELPADGWWPLFGDAPAEASGGDVPAVDASAAPTEIPVFVRPGTILPLLLDPVDSFYAATEDAVTGLDDVTGLRLALYPDGAGAVGPVDVDGTSASGGGWASPTFAGATWNGTALPNCDAVDEGDACVDPVSGFALVIGDGTLAAGPASLTVTGPEARRYRIAVGGAAWAPWNEPTPLGDLSPDIPPPCEVE